MMKTLKRMIALTLVLGITMSAAVTAAAYEAESPTNADDLAVSPSLSSVSETLDTEPAPEVSETPSTEPAPEVSETPSTEPAPEVSETPSAESVADAGETPSTEPVTEAIQEPSTEPVTEASQAPSTESVPEVIQEPNAEPVTEAIQEPSTEPVTEASQAPSTESAPEVIQEPSAELAPPAKTTVVKYLVQEMNYTPGTWETYETETPEVGQEYEIKVKLPVGRIFYEGDVSVYGIKEEDIICVEGGEYTVSGETVVFDNPRTVLKIKVPDRKMSVQYSTQIPSKPEIVSPGLKDLVTGAFFRTPKTSAWKNIKQIGKYIALPSAPMQEGYDFKEVYVVQKFYSSTDSSEVGQIELEVSSRNLVTPRILDDGLTPFNYSRVYIYYYYEKQEDPEEEPQEPEEEPEKPEDPEKPDEPETPNTDVKENTDNEGSGNPSGYSDTQPEIIELEDEEVPLAEMLTDEAYMVGYPDGTFQPQGNTTRAEVSTIFSRIMKLEIQQGLENPFVDLLDSHWAKDSILTLADVGVFHDGYLDGTFKPNQSITRGELAQVVAEYLEKQGVELQTGETQYSDIENHWAKEAILKVSNQNIIKGFEDNTFRPNEFASREQVVLMVNGLTSRAPLNGAPQTYSDVTPDYSEFKNIEKASTNHVYTTSENGEDQFVEEISETKENA